MRTILPDGSSSRNCSEALTSSGVSSSSSYSTDATGGFEGVATSFTITKFSPSLIKTEG
jgi:hypothetical protein